MTQLSGPESLQALAIDELPPSRVDLDRAIAVGRSRERRRQLGAAAAVAAATALVIVVGSALAQAAHGRVDSPAVRPTAGPTRAVPAEAPCVARTVELPVAGKALAAIDPSGRYLAGYVDVASTNVRKAVLWTDGRPQYLDPPGAVPTPIAVNAAGMVAGRSQRSGHSTGWLFRDGHYVQLGVPKGAVEIFVTGLNARGDVVGWAAGPDSDISTAVLWPVNQNGTVKVLDTGADGEHRALAVGDDGTAYGVAGESATAWHPDGTTTTLPGLDGDNVGKVFHVAGDWAYGVGSESKERFGGARFVRWNLRTRQIEWPTDIRLDTGNANGWMIGTKPASSPGGIPIIKHDGRIRLLGGIGKLAEVDGEGTGLSDDGKTAVGGMISTDRHTTALVTWRC
jgi:hypothetical protein